MLEKINGYGTLMGNSFGKRTFERRRRRCEDNIKM
jgi:hypothetical protein